MAGVLLFALPLYALVSTTGPGDAMIGAFLASSLVFALAVSIVRVKLNRR